MNITWFSHSVFKDGKYAIKYRAPDGVTSQTLWYSKIELAACQYQQIKDDWRANERLGFIQRETEKSPV